MTKQEVDKAVKREIARLKKLYQDIDPKEKTIVEGLIVQAARLRVSLDILWDDIIDKGDVELFTQSDKTEPYERERPVARLFNSRDKNYQTIIKQLNDRLPEDKATDASEELLSFAFGKKKK